MLNPANLIANAVGDELVGNYRDMYGDREPEYAAILRATSKLVVERIANSDALYHDSHHTVMVTLVGQAILKGRILVEQVDPVDWLHFTVALLCHDLGYLRGICPGDTDEDLRHGRARRGGAGAARRFGRLPDAVSHRARQDVRAPAVRDDGAAR